MKPRKTTKNPSSGTNQPLVINIDQGKQVRSIARERVAHVKPSEIIAPKKERKKPKHKKPVEVTDE